MNKSKVLFLCVGNSCRSQMAEAMVNARLGDLWEAFSAGSNPAASVHPFAIKVLSEIGIEHHGSPKSIAVFTGQAFDVVITLCDDSDDNCPIWLGGGKKLHRPFLDPTQVIGSDEWLIRAFRQVRDEIAEEIIPLLSLM